MMQTFIPILSFAHVPQSTSLSSDGLANRRLTGFLGRARRFLLATRGEGAEGEEIGLKDGEEMPT
jgi:hypothetical protein